MKKIIYTRPDGGLSIVNPAPWARLCAAITVAGERLVMSPPVPFDGLVRAHKTDQLSPEWAETEDEFIARVRGKDVPADALDVRVVDEAAIPADRTFRAAWKAGAAGVAIDMVRAREVRRGHLRAMRKPLLEALDVEFMRAMERGSPASEISAIAARKQALRDVTKDAALEAATTPEELKALEPAAIRAERDLALSAK
jgi:hypothetical protein